MVAKIKSWMVSIIAYRTFSLPRVPYLLCIDMNIMAIIVVCRWGVFIIAVTIAKDTPLIASVHKRSRPFRSSAGYLIPRVKYMSYLIQ